MSERRTPRLPADRQHHTTPLRDDEAFSWVARQLRFESLLTRLHEGPQDAR